MQGKYQSKYTEKLVSEAQYLVDLMMERIAIKEKTTLPHRYWKSDIWSKIFKHQIVKATRLLGRHSLKDIVAALNTFRGKKLYSLGLEKPIDEIIARQKEVEKVDFDTHYEDPYE